MSTREELRQEVEDLLDQRLEDQRLSGYEHSGCYARIAEDLVAGEIIELIERSGAPVFDPSTIHLLSPDDLTYCRKGVNDNETSYSMDNVNCPECIKQYVSYRQWCAMEEGS